MFDLHKALFYRARATISLIFFLLHFLFGAHPAAASTQPESLDHYQYVTWSAEAGLPQVTITGMARAADGRMWLGTQNGLVRLDGQDVEVFQVNGVPEMGSNWIKHLLATKHGDLWLSTIKHLVLWRNDQFSVIAKREELGEVTALVEDSSGRVWVAADKLWYVDGTELVKFEGWQGSVRALVASGNMWLATDSNEILQLGKSEPERFIWPSEPPVVRQMALIKQRLWVATNEGLYRSQGKNLERVTEQSISALTSFGNELWFASEAGVFRWRGDRVEAQLSATTTANFPLVTQILVDETRGFWLGSQASGARYYWRAPYVQMSKDDGLTETSWSLLADHNGLLVGTNQGLFNYQDGAFKSADSAAKIPGGVAYSLLRDSLNRLWVGSREGLAVYENKRWRTLDALQGQQVNSLVEAERGDILIAGSRGLHRWHNAELKPLEGTEALIGQSVRTILQDQKQTIWLGTENGLWQWREGNLSLVAEVPLSQDFIPALLQLQDGRLIAATYQRGIFIKSGSSGWKPITLDAGLPTKGAFGLFEHEGWVWISNGDGVQRIAVSQLEKQKPLVQVLYHDQGQKLGRSLIRCCNGGGNGRAVVSDGYAWFASLAGVVRIDLNLPEVKVPVAKIHKVLDAASSPSRKMKDVEIHYSALDFKAPHQLVYRYRLKPYSNQWQDAFERRIAYYTNLPPGKLVFEVQAKQAFGDWGPTASAVINVEPIYYETLWFKILLFVFMVAAGYGLFRIRTLSLRVSGERLAEEIKARTAQLEQMNTELERVNGELHLASITDPLTGLHNRRFMTEQIGSVLARMKRQRQTQKTGPVLGFFLIDLDWFKHVNDRYGHGVGDTLLAETANQLKKACRESDMLLRWGGEEFLLLAPDSDPVELSGVAERLRHAVFSAGEKMGLPQRISASIGYVPHPLSGQSDIDNWAFTLALADYCLYQAKAAGRNCCVTATLDDDLMLTYREAKITSTELKNWQDDGRLHVVVVDVEKAKLI